MNWRRAGIKTADGQNTRSFGQNRRTTAMAAKIASNYSLPIANRYEEMSPMYARYYYPANASAAPHMLLHH
jgi:hypothetical protein